MTPTEYIILGIAAIPSIYYLLALYSTAHFLADTKRRGKDNADFTPPVSCLKPIKGLDIDAYENYSSFCRQNYPEYEILFCVDPDDPALPVLEKYIAMNPIDPTVNYYISAIHFQRHNFNQSWKYLKAAEKIVFAKEHKPRALQELRQALQRACPEPHL